VTDQDVSTLPAPSEGQQRQAKEHFQYAHRASVGGDFDLAIQHLRRSCVLAPATLSYRQALRKAQKAKYHNNKRGSLFAALTALPDRLRMRGAAARGDQQKALEHAEAILARNPWDKSAQLGAAEAAAALGLPVVAIWVLQQARDKHGKDAAVNRALARLLEKQGYFNQAIQLWELVRQAVPADREAQYKVKQLGATETIARGNYGEVVTEGTVAEATDPTPTPAPEVRKLKPVKAQAVREKPVARRPAEEHRPAEPTDPGHYLREAATLTRGGRLDEARETLKRGLSAAGQSPELLLALEGLEIEPARRRREKLEAQARARPDDEALARALAELTARINERELAHCRKRAEHDPSDNGLRLELGQCLLRAGSVDEAIVEFQALRNDTRLRWKALMQLGVCFESRKNWKLAQRNLEEALRLLPAGEDGAKKELLLRLAKGHAAAGERERAVELGTDLADMDFSYGQIGRLLDEWQK
jgi:Flp pilus assembly protein TadD